MHIDMFCWLLQPRWRQFSVLDARQAGSGASGPQLFLLGTNVSRAAGQPAAAGDRFLTRPARQLLPSRTAHWAAGFTFAELR